MRHAQPIPRRIQNLLTRRKERGLSIAELSRRTGVPAWKLRYWQERLQKDSGKSRIPPAPPELPPEGRQGGFLTVEIVGSSRTATPLELLTPSGFRLLVPVDFDPGHLRRVIAALESGC